MNVLSLTRLGWCVLSLLLLSACGRNETHGSDDIEKEHPAILEAKEKVKLQDPDGAIVILENLIREEPAFAYGHLQLGFAFQIKEEPVKSLYHFQRYLEERPDTSNAEVVQLVVRDELKRLATRVGVSSGPVVDEEILIALENKLRDSRREVAKLSILLEQAGASDEEPTGWAAEKLALMAQIEQLQLQAETAQTRTRVTTTSPEQVRTPGVRTYVVKRGDNLSLIAKKMYGKSSEWTKIHQANLETLPSVRALKPGMELVIPD